MPINLLTLWLTSSFVVERTRQAAYCFGSDFAATTMPPPSVVAVRCSAGDSMVIVAPSRAAKPIAAPVASATFDGGVAFAVNGPLASAVKNSSLVRFGFGGTARLVLFMATVCGV